MKCSESTLKRTLGPVMLWGLGVGYVISGEYFGWNLGLPLGGTYGMLLATLFVTVMYITFVLSYTELACALPHAGGAFVYCREAFGHRGAYLAGVAQCMEFVFAPPAIAMALGAYMHQRYTGLSPQFVAIAAYVVFTALNAWGVKQAALFELCVTLLAVFEILLFAGFVAPHFSLAQFENNAWPHGWSGAFACIPFAMWFYLAIEGVANAAEDARDPNRDVRLGLGLALCTLVVLVFTVFFAAVGVGGWEAVVYETNSTSPSDAPLPLALAQVVSKTSPWYTLLLGVGMLGLVASFHGIILAAARVTMAMGQGGYFASWLGHVHPRTQTPVWALMVNLLVGVLAILTGHTAEIITLACFGAASVYLLSMGAFFKLRHTRPDLLRPYRTPGYPWVPGIALGTAMVVFAALAMHHIKLFALFMIMLSVAWKFRPAASAR